MILTHIREIRDKGIHRWILALYDTERKRFISSEKDDQILLHRQDARFGKQLEEILEYFKKQGCTNVSSAVREQIFEKNGIPLPEGWRSFNI